jgi:hypothetical protein
VVPVNPEIGQTGRFASPSVVSLPERHRVRMTSAKSPQDAATAFASQAERYVRWLDRVVTDEVPTVNMRELHELLGLLQAAAARMSAGPPGDEPDRELDFMRISTAQIRPKLPIDAYSVVFDPFEYDPLEQDPPKPVMAMISDDLHDIYADLMKGLTLYRAGQSRKALWQWHFTYYTHWGRHLSHAQSAIWQYLSERNWA